MLCKEFVKMMEDVYPSWAAEEWDNVGLLVGRAEKEICKVYVALDATDEVIEEAIRQKADLLLTHHPLLFSPLKRVVDEDLTGRRLLKMVQHDLCYYTMHTNYDVLRMAEVSAQMLGLSEAVVMQVTDKETDAGIGRVGDLSKPLTVRELAELVKEKFQLESVKVYGDLEVIVSRVAISPGSGKHMSQCALEKGAQVFVTAEIDHHEALDANALGMAILDAGHYGLEHIFIHDVADYLKKNTRGLEIIGAPIEHPFRVI